MIKSTFLVRARQYHLKKTESVFPIIYYTGRQLFHGMIPLSVIIPVLNEKEKIRQTIFSLRAAQKGREIEIIVVDGDREGGTLNVIRDTSVKKIVSPAGRAVQMNHGADAASGDIILFLHADTRLPDDAFSFIASIRAVPYYDGGAFDLGFDNKSLVYRIIARAASLKHRMTRVPYGDQALFFKRDYFYEVGKFRDIPLMEDVEFMKRIKRRGGKISISASAVRTSVRKWEADGIVMCVVRNWLVQALYLCGVSPAKLVNLYYRN